MTCLQLCVLFNFQICGTFQPVFMNIFLRSRLTLCKCVVSAFIQRSWRIRNWTIIESGYYSNSITCKNTFNSVSSDPKQVIFKWLKAVSQNSGAHRATSSSFSHPYPNGKPVCAFSFSLLSNYIFYGYLVAALAYMVRKHDFPKQLSVRPKFLLGTKEYIIIIWNAKACIDVCYLNCK